jgi:uncharacterized protein (TIGR02118 family)
MFAERPLAAISTKATNVIKLSVLYPKTASGTFDIEYYCNKHIIMVRERLGRACKGLSVDQGLSGPAPGTQPAYFVMGHLLFDSVEDFQTAFAPHAQEIIADTARFTNVEPIVQISNLVVDE